MDIRRIVFVYIKYEEAKEKSMKKKLLAVILAIAVSCQSLPVYAGEMADIFSDSGTEMSEEEKVTDDFSDGEAKKNVETTEEMSQTDPEFISPEEEPAENILKDDQNENDSSDENSDENQVSAYSADIELTYGDYKYIVSGQEATVIKYIGSESTVKLPEKINNYVVNTIGERAFQSCLSLTEIEIPDSVEEIGDSAFQNCGSLTEVTGGRRLKKIGYEAFEYCRKLESITLYPTITSISGFAFDECQFLTIYGYTGTYAETYASGQNIPFRSLGEYTSKYEEYDYTENLNRWIQDEGTASAMAYLTRDGNFMNSMLVAQWDDSFIDSVVETMSNMYFRGKDGWKQIFSGETSQNQAREVLIALLDSYSGTVLDLSQAETTKKFAKIYLDTFKQGDWAYAVAYGLSNDEIKKLASVCTEDTLSAFFVDKK